jgi:hypothetical protein
VLLVILRTESCAQELLTGEVTLLVFVFWNHLSLPVVDVVDSALSFDISFLANSQETLSARDVYKINSA